MRTVIMIAMAANLVFHVVVMALSFWWLMRLRCALSLAFFWLGTCMCFLLVRRLTSFLNFPTGLSGVLNQLVLPFFVTLSLFLTILSLRNLARRLLSPPPATGKRREADEKARAALKALDLLIRQGR